MKKKNSNHPRLLRLRYALFCLGKTFRTRKNEMHSRDTSNVIKDKNTFTAIDDEGKEAVCNILFTFDNADESRHYIVYTDNSKDNEGNVQVYASMYDPQSEGKMELFPIETDDEWATIDGILEDVQNKIRNGEPIDLVNDGNEYDEEDEVLESLPFAILKSVNDWSHRLHYPVGTLLPYIIGLILFRLICPNPLSIWAEIGFVLVEVLLMRISYDSVDNTHVAISWCIIMFLYTGILMFALVPLYAKLFTGTARIILEPWGIRGAGIVVSIILILRSAWKKRKEQRAWRKHIG